MSLCPTKLKSLGPQQPFPLTKHLIERTAKGIDVDLSTKRSGGSNFWSFVVASPTVIVNFRVVSEADLSNAKVNEICTFLLLRVHEHHIPRFKIPMNDPNSLPLLLPLLPTPIPS